mmetsp:Transcript_22905/g.74799  ORF Transcript_22905/g.74799 Transcript_22905/m.74799 type:complete len:240 (-) Transcript_22905:968-1687(-)
MYAVCASLCVSLTTTSCVLDSTWRERLSTVSLSSVMASICCALDEPWCSLYERYSTSSVRLSCSIFAPCSVWLSRSARALARPSRVSPSSEATLSSSDCLSCSAAACSAARAAFRSRSASARCSAEADSPSRPLRELISPCCRSTSSAAAWLSPISWPCVSRSPRTSSSSFSPRSRSFRTCAALSAWICMTEVMLARRSASFCASCVAVDSSSACTRVSVASATASVSHVAAWPARSSS